MKNKLGFWFITVVMSVLVLYSLLCNVILPVMTKNQLPKTSSHVSGESVKEVKKEAKKEVKKEGKKEDKKKKAPVSPSREETASDASVANNDLSAKSKLFELKKSEEFLKAKLNLVNDDSSYLVLDMVKKTATLEMKGISLYECHILNSHISNSIKDQPAGTLLNWLGEPFSLRGDNATIPKTSFIVKIAPKDTIEANKVEETPVAPKRGDVYVVMDFDRNLRLIIQQAEKPDKDGKRDIDSLQWRYKKSEIINSVNAIIRFSREPITPTIEIVLSKEDATILYRALPFKPKMILRL
jgi:hypothetical protein